MQQCKTWSDATSSGVWSGFALFAYASQKRTLGSRKIRFPTCGMCDQQRLWLVWSYAHPDHAWIFYDSKATDRTAFGVFKLKRRLLRLVWVYACQKATSLEITCHSSCVLCLYWGFMVQGNTSCMLGSLAFFMSSADFFFIFFIYFSKLWLIKCWLRHKASKQTHMKSSSTLTK